MLEKLGDATMFVGQKMAPVVKTQANKYLPERFKVGGDDQDANKVTATDKALTLISGGLEGFVVVYQGLEAAGRILASSCAQEGVKLLDRRYGAEVAEAASGGLEAVGNIGKMCRPLRMIVKSIDKPRARTNRLLNSDRTKS